MKAESIVSSPTSSLWLSNSSLCTSPSILIADSLGWLTHRISVQFPRRWGYRQAKMKSRQFVDQEEHCLTLDLKLLRTFPFHPPSHWTLLLSLKAKTRWTNKHLPFSSPFWDLPTSSSMGLVVGSCSQRSLKPSAGWAPGPPSVVWWQQPVSACFTLSLFSVAAPRRWRKADASQRSSRRHCISPAFRSTTFILWRFHNGICNTSPVEGSSRRTLAWEDCLPRLGIDSLGSVYVFQDTKCKSSYKYVHCFPQLPSFSYQNPAYFCKSFQPGHEKSASNTLDWAMDKVSFKGVHSYHGSLPYKQNKQFKLADYNKIMYIYIWTRRCHCSETGISQ